MKKILFCAAVVMLVLIVFRFRKIPCSIDALSEVKNCVKEQSIFWIWNPWYHSIAEGRLNKKLCAQLTDTSPKKILSFSSGQGKMARNVQLRTAKCSDFVSDSTGECFAGETSAYNQTYFHFLQIHGGCDSAVYAHGLLQRLDHGEWK